MSLIANLQAGESCVPPPARPSFTEGSAVERVLRGTVEAGRVLAESPDLAVGLQRAVETFACLTRHERCYALAIDWNERVYRLVAEHTLPPCSDLLENSDPWLAVPCEEIPDVTQALLRREVWTSTSQVRRGRNRKIDEESGSTSHAVVPILIDGELWGCVGLETQSTAHLYTSAEKDALKSFAESLAAAIRRDQQEAQRRAEAEYRSRLLRAVAEASAALSRAADLREGITNAGRLLCEATRTQRMYLFRYDVRHDGGFLAATWSAPGAVGLEVGAGPFTREDYREVWEPLIRGEIYSSPISLKSGANKDLNASVGTVSDLFVPLFVGGRFWGGVCFDDCLTARQWNDAEIDVLKIAAESIAAHLQRHALEAEKTEAVAREREAAAEQRAAEFAKANAALRRGVERIVRDPGIQTLLGSFLTEAVAAVGGRGGAVMLRVPGTLSIFRPIAVLDGHILGPDELAEDNYFSRYMEISAADGASIISGLASGTSPGITVESLRGVVDEAFEYHAARGDRVIWHAPLLLEGAVMGFLAISLTRDECPSESGRETVAALAQQVVLAHELTRLSDEAREAAVAVEREAAAQKQAAEAECINTLLQSVVAASRALLDAPTLDEGLRQWCEGLATAAGADRAAIGEFRFDGDGAHPIPVNRINWTRQGLDVLDGGPLLGTSDFAEWTRRLLRGESFWITADGLQDPSLREYWFSVACRCMLIVPVMIGGRAWGYLYVDFHDAREEEPALCAVLRTAADGAAAAIRRDQALRAVEGERLAHLCAEQERAAELGKLNEALRQRDDLLTAATLALRELLGGGKLDTTVDGALRIMGEAAGMHRVKVILQRGADTEGHHELVHEWSAPGLRSHRELGLLHFPNASIRSYLERLVQGDSVWEFWEDTPGHLRDAFAKVGMRSMGVVPIFSGTHYAGMVAFDDCQRRRQWTQAETDALTIAAQAIGAAIQCHQMEEEKSRAVLEERTRIARDLHDSLMHGLTGILMHAQAAASARGSARSRIVAGCLEKIQELTRRSLRQARHSVTAMEAAIDYADLPARLHDLVQGFASSGVAFSLEVTEACSVPADVGLHLLRIAEEAVGNALRYASARKIALRLRREGEVLLFEVVDDGCGFDTEGPASAVGTGLAGMRTRAGRLHAAFALTSAPGAGTKVRVSLSL